MTGELLAVLLNDSLRGEPEADAVALATSLGGVGSSGLEASSLQQKGWALETPRPPPDRNAPASDPSSP